MPRPPKSIHPIRVLRTALHLTQEQLATNIGVSASYVNAVECSGKPTPDHVCEQVFVTYGIWLWPRSDEYGWGLEFDKSIPVENKLALLRTASSMLCAIDFFKEGRRKLNDEVDVAAEIAASKLHSVFLAASGHGKVASLFLLFQRWLEETVAVLGTPTAAAMEAIRKEKRKSKSFIPNAEVIAEDVTTAKLLEIIDPGSPKYPDPPLPEYLKNLANECGMKSTTCHAVQLELTPAARRKAKKLQSITTMTPSSERETLDAILTAAGLGQTKAERKQLGKDLASIGIKHGSDITGRELELSQLPGWGGARYAAIRLACLRAPIEFCHGRPDPLMEAGAPRPSKAKPIRDGATKPLSVLTPPSKRPSPKGKAPARSAKKRKRPSS